ncbi:hypothetical protein JAAARDRAFT_520067 [Jaapia argillacea MUCL 33604]|uniref:Protein kinase domain-containing protein n=1 Tax=Jaapia argillacea MUCL 33604 TaxID=933084 RepID=A0A067Q418_9AGAM|nr:hypothetical protein JAAARDRAFT_520067 [Jaapia argillacea MUCL 33604]
MAAAVLSSPISNPVVMASRTDPGTLSPTRASSSRIYSQPSEVSDPSPKTFKRLRSSLEQSIRTATRSRVKSPPVDDFATITAKKDKGKGKETSEEAGASRMIRKLGSRVWSRSPKETPYPSDATSPTDSSKQKEKAAVKIKDLDKDRIAGWTSYITPSLRGGSMSSPNLLPSPSSPSSPSPPPKPPKDGPKRSSLQVATGPKEIGPPAPLTRRRRESASNVGISSVQFVTEASPREQKPAKHRPPPLLPSSPSSTSLASPILGTPSRRQRETSTPRTPETPTPHSTTRNQLGHSRKPSSSTSNLPRDRSVSPTSVRPISPASPTTGRRNITPTQRGLNSASTSHLPSSPPSSPIPIPQRRPSIDSTRPLPSPASIRASSPSTPTRPRAVSPVQHRGMNASTTSLSLSSPGTLEQRELIRNASSMLCKEIARPAANGKTGMSMKEWEEVEYRMRKLSRLERVWGRSGAPNASQSSVFAPVNSGATSSSGDRERVLFSEALKDGYVLCQLLNKLRPGSILRPDAREDGFRQTSNVTKFLAACSQFGLPSKDLFQRDDLIEGTFETLSRVAHTIISLLRLAESPPVDRSKYISGGNDSHAKKLPATPTSPGPYGHASSRLAASTPNLTLAQRSTSPIVQSPSTPKGKKRWSPTSPGLPTVRSDSPAESSGGSSNAQTAQNGDASTNGRSSSPGGSDLDEVPPMAPPRSPLRTRSPSTRQSDVLRDRASMADSTRASFGDNGRDSMADMNFMPRQSIASTATDTTAMSSLLEMDRTNSGQNKFGTMRTYTTEATSFVPSEFPSMTRTEGSFIADEMARKRSVEGMKRERRPSEAPAIDLTRVAEEVEESSASGRSSSAGKLSERTKLDKIDTSPGDRVGRAPAAIKLGKGKWPDDFLDAFQPSQSPPRTTRSPISELRDNSPSPSPSLIASPRKIAYIGASKQNDSVDSLPPFAPRRPTHRPRHSIDTPALLPKDSLLRRDSSPDPSLHSARGMLRRNSTKTGPIRNGMYVPRTDEPRSSFESDRDPPVPFPRTLSGDLNAIPLGSSPNASQVSFPGSGDDRPRQPRGRFQSEIEGASARRRPRPESYDDLGAKPGRSRFESMVNLGVANGNASASDIMSRNSLDGSAVRQTLIVKEEGKPPTQYQLGNCIGRGQFGSVYRALNLNTGQMVAVKRIRLEGLKEEEISQLMKEVDLLKSLSHPGIVKYEGMARDKDTLSIVLELAENGSLGQTLKAFGKLNERLVASYVVKILEGLHYLHSNDVVHCDLKAANILTTKNGNVKLSDFGVSLNMRAMEREMKDVAGTPNWMAPEVIELKGASTKSDIWSLACTVIELLSGRPPYGDIPNSMTVMFRIVEEEMPPLPEGCSDLLQDFLTICFNKEPSKRPSAEELCEHEWLKKNWVGGKELRPQDSIPFLRRVSADFQKSEAVHRYLTGIDIPSTPSPVIDDLFFRGDELFVSGTPPQRRMSNSPSTPRGQEAESPGPRDHSFIKTTFSKAMMCRVCLDGVKKNAVLCEQCSLIAHAKCAANAPPTCDLRAQLLLYAQYAEKGNPGSAYSSAMDVINGITPGTSPSSEVAMISSPRPSLDSAPASQSPLSQSVHPPTAYNFKMFNQFKRSKTSLSPEPGESSSTPSLPSTQNGGITGLRKKHSVLLKRKQSAQERPVSIHSDSKSSSMRSAATAAESFSSRVGGQSMMSGGGTETGTRDSQSRYTTTEDRRGVSRMSAFSHNDGVSEADESMTSTHSNTVPGDLSAADAKRLGRKKHRGGESKSSNGNCLVQ